MSEQTKVVPCEPTEEMLIAWMRADGSYAEPFSPDYEGGVQMSCGMSQDDCDQVNGETIEQYRRGYKAILAAAAQPSEIAATQMPDSATTGEDDNRASFLNPASAAAPGTFTFNTATGDEMLRVGPNGFYVRGVKVPQDGEEAKKVYDTFIEWLRAAMPGMKS